MTRDNVSGSTMRRRPRPRKAVEKTVGCFNQFRIIMSLCLVSPINASFWMVLCRRKPSISDLVLSPSPPPIVLLCLSELPYKRKERTRERKVQEKGTDVAER